MDSFALQHPAHQGYKTTFFALPQLRMNRVSNLPDTIFRVGTRTASIIAFGIPLLYIGWLDFPTRSDTFSSEFVTSGESDISGHGAWPPWPHGFRDWGVEDLVSDMFIDPNSRRYQTTKTTWGEKSTHNCHIWPLSLTLACASVWCDTHFPAFFVIEQMSHPNRPPLLVTLHVRENTELLSARSGESGSFLTARFAWFARVRSCSASSRMWRPPRRTPCVGYGEPRTDMVLWGFGVVVNGWTRTEKQGSTRHVLGCLARLVGSLAVGCRWVFSLLAPKRRRFGRGRRQGWLGPCR